MSVFILNFRLDTVIKTDGIYIRFFPFHRTFRFYAWETLAKCYVREYSPIGEYGGWGLRYSMSGKGKAYNFSGSKGLQLEFFNGDKLLLGTRKPEEITTILQFNGKLRV